MKTKLTLFVAVLATALFGMGCASARTVDSDLLEFRKDENGIRRAYIKGETEPYSGMSFAMAFPLSSKTLYKRAEGRLRNGLPVWDKIWDSNGKVWSHTKYYPNSVDIQEKESIVWWTRQGGHKEKHKRWNEKGELIFSKGWGRDGDQRSMRGWKMDGTKEETDRPKNESLGAAEAD